MRLGVALALVLSATTARAEGPIPIAVQPFSGRCFDAAQLAARVRARVGDVPVSVGAPPRGSHQEVRVAEHAGAISVEVTARDGHGQVVGSARRIVPADDCPTALEVAGLIVARAALPLNWREPPEPPPPPHKHPPATANTPGSTASGGEKSNGEKAGGDKAAGGNGAGSPATAAGATEKTPVMPATPPRAFPNGQPPDLRTIHGPQAREPGTIVLRMRPPSRRWVGELDAAVYGSFVLDDAGADNDEPGGELALGLKHGRFGAALRGTVERDFAVSASSGAGPLDLSLRRLTVGLEVHADVSVRVGVVRFVVGPELPLWIVRATGLPHPRTSTIPSFAVAARVVYHLDIGRLFMQGGVDFQVAPTSEDLTISGVGVIAHTPRLTIGPIFALGVNL